MTNLTVGFELEVSGHAGNVLEGLQRAGLTEHSGLHEYHCGCDACEPSMSGPLFKAQQDCTAAGEFITKILLYGSDEMERACSGIGAVLVACGASVGGNVGNHVHVNRESMDNAAQRRLMRLMGRYERDLHEIAAGPHTNMRGYNGNLTVSRELWSDVEEGGSGSRYNYGGYTLSWKDPTVEFRLWNSTRAGWRIRTHVGLSHALVTAAIDGIDCTERDTRCVEDVIGDYIDGPTWAGILRQRFSKGGIASA